MGKEAERARAATAEEAEAQGLRKIKAAAPRCRNKIRLRGAAFYAVNADLSQQEIES